MDGSKREVEVHGEYKRRVEHCPCKRPRENLVCLTCGAVHFNARIQMNCAEHPRVKFYSDLSVCPSCRSEIDGLVVFEA